MVLSFLRSYFVFQGERFYFARAFYFILIKTFPFLYTEQNGKSTLFSLHFSFVNLIIFVI